MRRCDPGGERLARLLGNLKLDRPLGFLLHDDRAGGYPTALDHIMYTECNQVAAAQLAVDGEIEQGEFPDSMSQLQPNPDGPDLFQLQRGLLAEQLALVPRYCTPFGLDRGRMRHNERDAERTTAAS